MSKSFNISVSGDIFEIAPNYRRIVLSGRGPADQNETSLLNARYADAIDGVCDSIDLELVAEHSSIAPWREAFRALGWSASKYRSSIEALLRRALRRQLDPLGNILVDAGTVATLESLVPIGVHVLDEVVGAELWLGPASGDERFRALDDSLEAVEPGEIVYSAGSDVLTRRWVWRQGRLGSVFGTPELIAVNVDLIDHAAVEEAKVVENVTELLAMCGIEVVGSTRLDAGSRSGVIKFIS